MHHLFIKKFLEVKNIDFGRSLSLQGDDCGGGAAGLFVC